MYDNRMKNKYSYTKPFGNSVSKVAIFLANVPYYFCKKIYRPSSKPLDLVAIPKGEVYKDFGVMTLVRRDDLEAQKDNVTGKLLKAEEIQSEKSMIIGTIRMGFGHWRIAIALASACKHSNVKPYLLDLISFQDTNIAKTIKFLDHWYSKLSRFSQSSQWFNQHIWEKITSQTSLTLDSCIQQRMLSTLFTSAFTKLPESIPILAAHPWVGHAAVLAGIKTVVTIVPDNLPLAFWLVEGSTHTVQSPSAYMGYRVLMHMKKGYMINECLADAEVVETGHYIDYEIESELKNDCNRRLERAKNGEPRRFLLTMGGAGAQAYKFADIATFCNSYVTNKKATFFINMGDHEGRCNLLRKKLDAAGIKYTLYTDWKKTKALIAKDGKTVITGIHIFLHSDFYAAVYATNLLLKISDVMITKPSELAYYPIPKLFIQRVGKHEAWGAIRSSEIGDGTKEIDTPDILHRVLKTLIEENDLFKMYIKHIMLSNSTKIYHGAENVVLLAKKLSKSATSGANINKIQEEAVDDFQNSQLWQTMRKWF